MIARSPNVDQSPMLSPASTGVTAEDPPDAGGRAQEFEVELAQWLQPLRLSLKQLLRELGSPQTPKVLQHRAGVPYVACWQVFRIARSPDATAEARHTPSPGMLKGLLNAARHHGGSDETIAAVAVAASDFHAFVTRHAGDRSTFNAMVAQMPTGGRSETLLMQRRLAAYRAISQVWGVQTDLQCMTSIVGPPAADGSAYTKITLMMQRGVRRLRANVPITLVGQHTRPLGRPIEWPVVPLDPVAADRYGMSILPAFSSPSLPEKIVPVTTESGWRFYELLGKDVGRRSSFEFVLGGHASGAPDETTTDGRSLHVTSFTISKRPVALLVIDVLLHRFSLPGVRPQSLVYQHQEGDLSQATAECSQPLPGDEKVEPAGRADLLDLPEAPRYADLLRAAAAASKGWDLADFDAYRIRVPYPVLGTTTRVYYSKT